MYSDSFEVVSRKLVKEVDRLPRGFRGGKNLDRVEHSDSDGSCNEGKLGYSILGMCKISSCGCCLIHLIAVGFLYLTNLATVSGSSFTNTDAGSGCG